MISSAGACTYDFSGSGQGGASSAVSSGGPTVTSSAGSTAAETSTSSRATSVVSTVSSAASEASSSTGFSPEAMRPCYEDDFTNFGNNGWTEHEDGDDTVALVNGGDVRMSGVSSASRDATDTTCFVSVTLALDEAADVHVGAQEDGQGAFGLRRRGSDISLFEGELPDVDVRAQIDLADVDAIALVFEATRIFGFARVDDVWTPVGELPRPKWLDGDDDELRFGTATAPSMPVFFHDFSIASPFL